MLPFRIIAIVHDEAGVARALDRAGLVGEPGLGIMLRDPDHRAARARALAVYALRQPLPLNVTLIMNGDPVTGIGWLHLPAARVDELAGLRAAHQGVRIGAAAHSLEEAVPAVSGGAAYVMISPLFPTSSKPGHPGLGIAAFGAIAAVVPVHAIALGGIIGPDEARACMAAGAYGIASRSLFDSDRRDDLARTVAAVRDHLHQHQPERFSR